MADSAFAARRIADLPADTRLPRHALFVRVTHWISAICVFALLLSGFEIVISHPRFYWGETGNVHTKPLLTIPIPASRATVPTGYGYVMPDQNGWSRALHFQTAWVFLVAGIVYLVFGSVGHFRKNLMLATEHLSPRVLTATFYNHLRFGPLGKTQSVSYNALQRVTYLLVIFFLAPVVIWTGLAMSPGFVAAFPATVTLLGGQQTARTVHFFDSLALLVFILVHIVMVCRAGFVGGMRAMITGRIAPEKDNA